MADRRWLTVAPWLLALAGALTLGLAVLVRWPGAAGLIASEGGATVHLSADRRWIILPGGCVTVAWEVSGVSAVYLNDQGVTGEGTRLLCAEGGQVIFPLLRITTTDGTVRFYTLSIPVLTGCGEFWLALVAIAVLGGAGAIGLSPALYARRRGIVTGALSLAAAGIGLWLIWQFADPAPLVIRTVERGGLVAFSATPVRSASDCTTLVWAVEGIREVRLNGEPVTGQGERRVCGPAIHDLRLTVTFRDGSQRDYRFPPNRLLYPAGLLLLCGAVLLVVVAVDVWRGARIRPALRLTRYDLAGLLTILLLGGLLFGYLLSQAMQTTDDLWTQIGYARQTAETGTLTRPNPLFLLLTIAAHDLSGGLLDYGEAVPVVALAGYLALAVILYVLLRRTLGQPETFRRAGGYGLLALALVIMEPIGLPWPGLDNWNARFAYILNNAYHNGPLPLVRPFALLQFVAVVHIFDGDLERRALLPAALIGLLALLAKPSYLIVLIPVMGLAVVWRLWRRQRIDWPLLGATVGAGILPLAWLYYYNYASPTGDAGIRFAPFAVYAHFAPEPWYTWLGPFMLLSLAFPLWVYAACFPSARRNTALNLAWLALIVGQGYYLLLTEGVLSAGNFRWGAQIALFILYVTSLIFFVRQARESGWDRRFRIGAAIFVLHILSGITAYIAYLAWVWSWIRPV